MLAYSQVQGVALQPRKDALLISYLAKRGIELELAHRLQLKTLPAAELIQSARSAPSAWQLLDDNRSAIVFPHFSIRGELLDWWSARLVAGPAAQTNTASNVASFAQYVDPDALRPVLGGKMFCPPNEPPHAYLPQGPGLPDWQHIPRGSRVYIHESAIKAINGALLDTYSVGLNGVWGFGSKKHDIQLVSELKDIPWKAQDLIPIILFDTNVSTNQQVHSAAVNLASRIQSITGRTPKLLRLCKDTDEAEDFGFDDYVQTVGDALARHFLATPDEDLEDLEFSELELAKLQLNEEFCVLMRTGRVGRIADSTLFTPDVFINSICADRIVFVDGVNDQVKEVNVPRLWMRDHRRTVVYDLTYAPGQPRLCQQNSISYLNRWPGWGCLPVPGDVTPWLLLMANNIRHPPVMEWLLDWFAYPLQNPGKKLHSYPLIFGEPGTGKDRLFAPIYQIYGQNITKISSTQLSSNFNSSYAERQFVQADELKSQHFTADAINQVIKGIVTNEEFIVNRKNQEEYTIPNVANLAITSNYVESVKLDEGDRRATVINWNSEAAGGVDYRGDSFYWTTYSDWCETSGGPAVFAYLLQRDLSNFKPKSWSLDTDEKEDVISAGRTGVAGFVHRLSIEPDMELHHLSGARQLFTAKELTIMYNEGKELTRSMLYALSRELKNSGFQQANGGAPLRVNGIQDRFWIVPRHGLPKLDWSQSKVCLDHLKVHLPGAGK